MKCDVYLSFDGNCEEAMNFYKETFGGEFTVMMRYSEGPPQYQTEENKNKIMHSTLAFPDGGELKASDDFHHAVFQ